MGYVSKLNSLLFKQFKPNKYKLRSAYAVLHNANRGTFYVKLDYTLKAVLNYTIDRKVLDIQTIYVPVEYKGQGIARILAESALTYAIVNDYFIHLTCEYLQHYYFITKNLDLEERVVGPPNILDRSEKPPPMSDPNMAYELPHPEEFMIK